MRTPYIEVSTGRMWPGRGGSSDAIGPVRVPLESLERVEKCFGVGMICSDAFEWVLRVQRSDLPVDVVEGGYVTAIGFMLHGDWFDDLTQDETNERMEAVRCAIVKRIEQLTRDFYDIFGRTYLRWSDREWSEEDPL